MSSPNRPILNNPLSSDSTVASFFVEPVTPKAHLSADLKKAFDERNVLTSRTKKCVLEALDEITNENESQSRLRTRQRLMAEIVVSEQSYVHQLGIIMNYFMRPVQEQKCLKPDQFDCIFSNITTIHRINSELLQQLLNGCEVGRAFADLAPFFKLYSVYAYEFRGRLEMLQNCQRHNTKFGKLIESQESRPEVQQKLSALLIAPIQRVPRYELLLSQLLKLTDDSGTGYKLLHECLAKITAAAVHINTLVAEQENMQRLLEIQRCLVKSHPNVIRPGRTLKREGELHQIDGHAGGGRHSERVYLVLMSDILLICKMLAKQVKPNTLKTSDIWPLANCKITEQRDKGCFSISCDTELIAFYCDSAAETREWTNAIRQAIDEWINGRKTLHLRRNSEKKPLKRLHVNDYNELGISPGKRLRKRRSVFDEPIDNEPIINVTPKTIAKNSHCQNTPPVIVSLQQSDSNERPDSPNMPKNKNTELFVFGAGNGEQGVTFQFSKMLGDVKNHFKKFFNFKNSTNI